MIWIHEKDDSDVRVQMMPRYKEDWDDGREGRAYGYYRYRDDPRCIKFMLDFTRFFKRHLLIVFSQVQRRPVLQKRPVQRQ